jgi:hypothetical protein
VIVPLLTERIHSLLHDDLFVQSEVLLSSFTLIDDDVLLILEHGILIVDRKGAIL